MMRTRTFPASLAAAALLLSGCSFGSPSADPTPIFPSSTTPTPTSTPTPTPEPWEVRSRAGVKAFLERYVEIFSDAFATGDTEAFRALGTNCSGCEDFADQIDEVYDAGGSITTDGGIKFAGWSVDETGLRDGCACVLITDSAGTIWVRSAGAKPENYPGGKNEYLVNLDWTGTGWTIIGLTGLQS